MGLAIAFLMAPGTSAIGWACRISAISACKPAGRVNSIELIPKGMTYLSGMVEL